MPTSVLGVSIIRSSGQRGTKQDPKRLFIRAYKTQLTAVVSGTTADAVNIGRQAVLFLVCRSTLNSL
jgi:hypothetical protein